MVTKSLSWRVASQRNSVHYASKPLIVIYWVVLNTAIIPKGERTLLPTKSAGELWPDLMLKEVVE